MSKEKANYVSVVSTQRIILGGDNAIKGEWYKKEPLQRKEKNFIFGLGWKERRRYTKEINRGKGEKGE